MNNQRPKLKLNLTTSDKIIELLGWLALIGIWMLTLFNYSSLPDIIPTHYNGAGEADGFGNKLNILTLPVIASILFIGMTILNKYPHSFNYLGPITEENAHQYYTNSTRLIRFLKLIIVIIFGAIVFKTIHNVYGNTDALGVWFLPITLGLIFIPIMYYLAKSIQGRKE